VTCLLKGGDSINSKYQEYLTEKGQEKLSSFSLMGYDTSQIAKKIGVSEKTLLAWCSKYPEINKAVHSGDDMADKLVEKALFKRAVGYVQTERVQQLSKEGDMELVKIVEKEVMPSTTAQIFWLKNRCGYEWDGRTEDEEDDESGVVVLPPIER